MALMQTTKVSFKRIVRFLFNLFFTFPDSSFFPSSLKVFSNKSTILRGFKVAKRTFYKSLRRFPTCVQVLFPLF